MKTLITGGAGFIGTALTNFLLNRGHEVIVLDNFLDQIHGDIKTYSFNSDVTYIVGDVRNHADWIKCLQHDPEILVHLASETGTGQSMDEITRYCSTNMIGTSVMLDVINNHKHTIKKVVLSSSRAVYGESTNCESNKDLKPISVYGVTKLTQEQLITAGCKVPYVILRYQNVYGQGQSLKNPYTGIISIFSNILNAGGEVTLFDKGLATRDFIHVEDVVVATYLSMCSDTVNNGLYNVGTGAQITISEVTAKLKKLLGSSGKIMVSDYHRPGDVLHATANVERIKNDLNWKSGVDIDSGLQMFVEWFKEQNS